MSMVFQCLALLTILNIHGAAMPISSNQTMSEPQLLAPTTTTDYGKATRRTLFNIIWNCMSTIFLCTWVSVHPNVPPVGSWRALRRRLQSMFWTIIAPELIVGWAVRQWFAAWEIKDMVNGTQEKFDLVGIVKDWFKKRPAADSGSNKWTMAHGHLLEMGGIHIIDPSNEDRDEKDPSGPVLTRERYEELTRGGGAMAFRLKLRKISKEDIQDKSKADFLSKLIAIMQTSWFIMQCIARGHQRIALTEFELATLALASLNGITYVFWWHKPLGVHVPIRIYFKEKAGWAGKNASGSRTPQGNQLVTVYEVISRVGWWLSNITVNVVGLILNPCKRGVLGGFVNILIVLPIVLVFALALCLFTPFPIGIILVLKILKTEPITEEPSGVVRGLIAARLVLALRKFSHQAVSFIANISEMWLVRFLDKSLSVPAFFFGWVFFLPTMFAFLLAATICFIPFFALLFLVSFIFTAVFGIVTSNSVSPGSAHVPPFYAPTTTSDKYSRMIVFAVFGVIFGGLHCIGWNFTYATRFEQQLWRGTSLAITAIPLIVAPIDYVLDSFPPGRGFLWVWVRLALDLTMTILLFVYVPARLSLIAQAVALLRTQPDSAFLVVDWTKYIPHIF